MILKDDFNIVNVFFEAVLKSREKQALIFKDRTISFQELEGQILKTANYFFRKGIRQGDRVLVFVPISIDLYRIVLSLFRIGATAVFIDEWVGIKRMNQCCRLAACQAFIGIPKAKILTFFLSDLNKIPIKLGLGYKNSPNANLITQNSRDKAALITFTTGTTGTPKGAIRTHELLYHQFKALERKLDPKPNDISITFLPIVVFLNLASGVTTVLPQIKMKKINLATLQDIISKIQKFKVNTLISSPFLMEKFSEYLLNNKIQLLQIQKIFTGGAPVFPHKAKLTLDAFSSAEMHVIYGSTEAEPISYVGIGDLSREKDFKKGLLVGKPDDSINVRIVKIFKTSLNIQNLEELNSISYPNNEIGEIIVSGNHVLKEYFKNQDANLRNKIFLKDQYWHRTGDCGYFDEKGNLYLMGRCEGVINLNHVIIYPFVFESYFSSLKEIEIGTVLLKNGILYAILEIKDWIGIEMAKSTIKDFSPLIQDFVFVKEIPRDSRHNSRIDYLKLHSLLPT